MWAIVQNGSVTMVVDTPIDVTINSIRYSKNIFSTLSEAALESLGIYTVVPDTSYNSVVHNSVNSSYMFNAGTNTVVEVINKRAKTADEVKLIVKTKLAEKMSNHKKTGLNITLSNGKNYHVLYDELTLNQFLTIAKSYQASGGTSFQILAINTSNLGNSFAELINITDVDLKNILNQYYQKMTSLHSKANSVLNSTNQQVDVNQLLQIHNSLDSVITA